MNFLTLVLTSGCNLACPECPMGEYRKDIGDPRNYNYIDLAKLREFLSDFIDPKDWIVELTGGEPTLSKEFPDTVRLLTEMEYRISVLTNTANMNAIGQTKNLKFFCTWHESQMMFNEFINKIKLCPNECHAVYYPNRKTKTDAKPLFEQNGIPVVYCSWNEDLLTFGELMFRHGIPFKPFKQITINNAGEFSVCAKMKPYANLYNYSKHTRNDFIPKQRTCTGFPTICPVYFRNAQAWQEAI